MHLDVLDVFRYREWVLSTAVAFVFWASTLWFIVDDWGRCKLQGRDVLMLLAAALTRAISCALSGSRDKIQCARGGAIMERLSLFPYLALLLWLGTHNSLQKENDLFNLPGRLLA